MFYTGHFSDEHGERFHQLIAQIERDYKGKDPIHMLGAYIYSIVRDRDERGNVTEELRKSTKKSFTK